MKIECDVTKQFVEVNQDPEDQNRASLNQICDTCTHPWASNVRKQNGPMRLVIRKMFDIYPERKGAQNDIIVLCIQENPMESIF